MEEFTASGLPGSAIVIEICVQLMDSLALVFVADVLAWVPTTSPQQTMPE